MYPNGISFRNSKPREMQIDELRRHGTSTANHVPLYVLIIEPTRKISGILFRVPRDRRVPIYPSLRFLIPVKTSQRVGCGRCITCLKYAFLDPPRARCSDVTPNCTALTIVKFCTTLYYGRSIENDVGSLQHKSNWTLNTKLNQTIKYEIKCAYWPNQLWVFKY